MGFSGAAPKVGAIAAGRAGRDAGRASRPAGKGWFDGGLPRPLQVGATDARVGDGGLAISIDIAHAAADIQAQARDVGGQVGSQEQGGAGDIVGNAGAAQRHFDVGNALEHGVAGGAGFHQLIPESGDDGAGLDADIQNTTSKLAEYNNFLGMNIGDSPSYYFSNAVAQGSILLIIAALAIPVLSAVTQWINVKLMPQATDTSGNDQQNSMMASMKMMNTIMPIFSAVFCFSLPAGVGLYWVASSVVRSIQQVAVNKHIDRMDLDQIIEKNKDKAKEKMEKRIKRMEKAGIDPKTINQYANMNTRNVQTQQQKPKRSISQKAASAPPLTQEEKEEAVRKSTEMYNKKAPKPGSITAKANMVRIYNENNNKPEKKKKSDQK